MNFTKITLSKETFLITYKLLYDALLLALITFFGLLVAEGILPGFVSSHVSLARVAMFIVLLLGAIAALGGKLQITYAAPTIKKNKLVPVLILLTFLMIGNSLLKFSFWENLVITISTIVLFLMLYQLIIWDKK